MLGSAHILLAFIGGAFASIGPVTDLPIDNALFAPDSYERTFVIAGGTLPGEFPVNGTPKTMVYSCSLQEVGTLALGNMFFINGVQFTPPSALVLLQIISGARTAGKEYRATPIL